MWPDVLTVLTATLGSAGWAFQIRQWVTHDDSAECWMWGCWTVSSAIYTVVMIGQREPWWALWCAGSAALGAWLWWKSWRKRKDRKRRLAELGEKSRARITALIGALKDASRGARPVLRPVHGGAQ